ncbi:HRDC domain-containing protein [Corynebacterium lipophiloflavum]|uniref:3'-5' exonuclease n=1 Tax=Corynebacterium lipophiloflavum (strain ATCC 700352 / DSM 44291 / CCUG 37336 / JCM 10383 / DMMZ 1944) TaxID=525263 RepID=C0XSM9_CORLD|nr:HRDC domain-containing protein [Corynebacterium lipophiloflavum]EEI16740.1 3'-5' exonuclease [Corynebacterium lipophiloflavum DSM 44291]
MNFELVDTPAAFRRAAAQLFHGRGPCAIDTERASSFRYDDRAFLVQVNRRDAGTFLFAPEGHRDALREALAPVIGGTDWILHAAGEDLPSLAELGLHPGTLFDTEIAARLAGFERPNLAAMVGEFTGVTLDNGYGREDWSTIPLPLQWQAYAADDVVYLSALAEGLTEVLDAAGKLEAAEQEFEHVRTRPAPAPKTWRDLKGISSLPTGRSLHLARALWDYRDARGRATDTSPHTLLGSKVILNIAKNPPRTPDELGRVRGFPARRRDAIEEWYAVIERACADAPSRWPDAPRDRDNPPSKSSWQRHHPESWQRFVSAREEVSRHADDIDVAPELLVQPALLRAVVWNGVASETGAAARALSAAGARPWQVDAASAAIARGLRAADSEAT